MTIQNLLIWAVIGIVAGWLAGVITKSDRNIWGDLVLGLIGALVAGLIVGNVGPGNSLLWSIIAATIAAVVLVLIKNMIMQNR
ncbi:MAG: GlsB/YeaQ/YmgE family stress response membrane protein [Chloroflexota bacterium]|nr:GlsB/YeaQ/YmgE family stress response membrane protein [Chloroflexota bacterium]